MGIVFAVCCLICSAGNDFIFKLFARRRRSRGVFAGLIGIVWFAVLCMMPQEWADGRATVWWGILSGFFSITANLLLIEAMGLQSAGICATIYRFNLLPVVFGAWILLGEKIGLLQGIGIAVAVIAVLCFLPSSEKTVRRRMRLARLGTGLVMMAALLRGAMGIAYKYAFLNGADRNGILLINALSGSRADSSMPCSGNAAGCCRIGQWRGMGFSPEFAWSESSVSWRWRSRRGMRLSCCRSPR